MIAIGPLLLASLVLAAGAVRKLQHPEQALAAWRALGLPGETGSLRVLACAELIVAATAAMSGALGATLALAAVFVGFAIAIGRLLATGHTEISCGCFGVEAAPVGGLHIALNLLCALAALAGAVEGSPSAPQLLGDESLTVAAAVVVAVGSGAYAMVVAFTRLPIAALTTSMPGATHDQGG